MIAIHEKSSTYGTEEFSQRRSKWRRYIRVLAGRKIVVFGFVVILLLIITALFAPFLSPYDPYDQNLAIRYLQPSTDHWLGTDPLGRDELSRIIFGTRASLQVGLVAVGIAAVIGITLGLLAGYFNGFVNTIIMRLIDTLMAIPPLILALTFAAVLGGGLTNLMISVGIAMVPTYCRLTCSLTLSTKENDYIMAGHAVGASVRRIMLMHLLPNIFPPLIVLITLNMGQAILIEAALSFLGLGIAPPGAAWGSMVKAGYRDLLTNPVLSFAPGLCIMMVVMAFNILGDGLRDALDPRLRGKI
ncbi:MAG: ABC transporter permease [Deltaproteobacteria bacterium]|nr:ABC transporter permease [Deltaproteobacteria bacterium]